MENLCHCPEFYVHQKRFRTKKRKCCGFMISELKHFLFPETFLDLWSIADCMYIMCGDGIQLSLKTEKQSTCGQRDRENIACHIQLRLQLYIRMQYVKKRLHDGCSWAQIASERHWSTIRPALSYYIQRRKDVLWYMVHQMSIAFGSIYSINSMFSSKV